MLTLPLPESIIHICRRLADAGGHAWLVGGSVRDLLLGLTPKDFDLEVYGLDQQKLQRTLAALGKTASVGQQFAVIKLHLEQMEIDVALPRSETKHGNGHRGFTVEPDPHLTPEQATLRRDFTINAMMYDPLNGRLLDLHHGRRDLAQRILRHVSPAFAEDPLRPLRAMQFAARFDLRLHTDSTALCRQLHAEFHTLPVERIWHEWRKWSLSDTPSAGLRLLREIGWLSSFPELEALIGCEQNPHWHPEGDVWMHTLQVCDQAARIGAKLEAADRQLLLFAALCHDLGKPIVSAPNADGVISSPNHSQAGIDPTIALLHRIGAPAQLLKPLKPLILEHITHLHSQPTARAVRRLAHRLAPAHIEMWEHLVEADASGRAPSPPSRPALPWLEEAQRQQHHRSRPTPILTGRMLIELGERAGPKLGAILARAYEAQLEGEISDADAAIAWYHANRS